MAKMIIMKGLPGCGKSTASEKIVKEAGNTIRINKDLIRTMLHFDKFTGPNEAKTRDAARALATTFLEQNVNVIIDDTNLNAGTMQSWKDLAKELGASWRVVDMTNVPVEECVERDRDRVKHVGGTVIKCMAIQNGLVPFDTDSVVLCDLDGTLSDTTHRLHYVKGENKDWKSFFSGIGEDPVRKEVSSKIIDEYNRGKTIIYVTARPEQYRKATLEWLDKNNLSFAYTVIMRRDGDMRPDTEVKQGFLDVYFPDKTVINKIYDDRPAVIRMWRENGLEVEDVGNGVDF